jgi:predicted nucleic acid-binding protein
VSVSFFDTNVLVYSVDVDEPDKQVIAQALLSSTITAGHAVISTQILQEFYWTITRKLPRRFAAAEAERVLRDLVRLPIVQVDVPIILAATIRVRTASIAFWDALIVESALAAGATRLLTEDLQRGQVFDGRLRVENPFLVPPVPGSM